MNLSIEEKNLIYFLRKILQGHLFITKEMGVMKITKILDIDFVEQPFDLIPERIKPIEVYIINYLRSRPYGMIHIKIGNDITIEPDSYQSFDMKSPLFDKEFIKE